MPHHRETRTLPYSAEQLYNMVLDIECYPEFLPWCKAARILERHEDHLLGELVIVFKGFRESYVSNITPSVSATAHNIDVKLVRGPFKHLNNHWRFVPHADGCEVHFSLDFEMKYRWMEAILGTLFARATEKMVSAFTARAKVLYS